MIDLHAHILPGVDDGAKSLSESVSLLRGYAQLGYTHVTATPHWAVGMPAIANQVIDQVRFVATDLGLQFSTARECRIHQTLVEHVERESELRVDGGRVILVELPWGETPAYAISVFESLLRRGFRPLLVHPERHRNLWESPSFLDELWDMGVPLQVNLGSITGDFGEGAQERAISLLESGRVSLVASDAHTPADVTEMIPHARVSLQQLVGPEITALLMQWNPDALHRGARLHTMRDVYPEFELNPAGLSNLRPARSLVGKWFSSIYESIRG